VCLFPNGALIRELRVREYKLERDESTTSFLIFLGRPLSDLAPYDPFPVLRRPSAADETLPLSKHSCHGIHFMLRFVRSYDIYLHMHLTHLDMVRAMTCRVRS